MDLSPNLLMLVVAVSFGSAIIGGMGGFGTGIILTATLTPILGIKAVVPVLALAGIIINIGRFWFYRRDFDARAVRLVLPPALVCLLGGTLLYRHLDAARLAIVIGLVVLAALPARRYLKAHNLHLGARGLAVGGGIFGFLNGIASGMGVVLISLLLGSGLSGTAVLATDALVTIAVDITRSVLFSKFDLLPMPDMVLGGIIGLASLPGSWVASLLVRRLGHRLHIAIIETLIAAGGLSILFHGIRAL
ncbi:MAG: TSUP family transporter [Rhodocyclales bacterium]|nr:TSUP family transporter [Rhodocyclales bacterium]